MQIPKTEGKCEALLLIKLLSNYPALMVLSNSLKIFFYVFIFDVNMISFVLFVGKRYTTCTISTTKIFLLLTVFKSGVNGIICPTHQDYQSAESVKENK